MLALRKLFDFVRLKFLNYQEIRALVHNSLSVSQLFNSLEHLPKNALIIGRNNAWLILCGTATKDHVIGTGRTIRVRGSFKDMKSHLTIKHLILRHASPNSTILVYYLHGSGALKTPICRIGKKPKGHFQDLGDLRL